jgi:hypothetical protein
MNVFFQVVKKILFYLVLIGEYGFLLPDTQIIPSGQETLAGLLALLKYIEGHVYA